MYSAWLHLATQEVINYIILMPNRLNRMIYNQYNVMGT